MNKRVKEYHIKKDLDWQYLKSLIEKSRENPNYSDYCITIDSMYDSCYYESGRLISISPTREGFDELYEKYEYLYRGGYKEIKVGDDYIIYGFDFD